MFLYDVDCGLPLEKKKLRSMETLIDTSGNEGPLDKISS